MLRILRQSGILTNNCNLCSIACQKMSVQVETLVDKNQEIIADSKKRLQTEENDLPSIEENAAKKQKVEEIVRIRKRNFAMLMGYLGKNYYGMQRNPNISTIEECLITALFKANLINSDAFDVIQNINFQRAARTDKGVSAVRQVVSLKLPETVQREEINALLPEDIRVFGLRRVTKGFNSKQQCDARTYSYTLPTYAFVEESPEILTGNFKEEDIEKRIEELSTIDGKPYTEFRLTPEMIEKLKSILKLFEGTHNFYNFTSKVKPLDPRAKRFIMKFDCSEPFVLEGSEFITLNVKGQSFMLHQIRKMVGLVVGIARNLTSEEVVNLAFTGDKIDIPIVPGLGLVLNIVHYDYYNNRYGNDGMHAKLDWADCEEEVQQFLKENILKHIIQTEINEKSFLTWLGSLPFHTFSLREQHRNKNNTENTESSENTKSTDDTESTEDTISTEDAKSTEDVKSTEDTKSTENTKSTEDTKST